MSLGAVTRYYEAAGVAVIKAELVHHEMLHAEAKRGRLLDRRLSDFEHWGRFRRKLRRTFWDLLNTPLPMNHKSLGVAAAGESLVQLAAGLRGQSDPALVDEAVAVGGAVTEIGANDSDPLGDHARGIFLTGSSEESVLVIRDRAYRDAIARSFRSQRCPVRVVIPAEVSDLPVAETMVIAGQIKFYPQHLLNAPRAEDICILRYSWLGDLTATEPLLPAGARSQAVRVATPPDTVEEEDFVAPAIDWSALRQGGRFRATTDDASGAVASDREKARLHLLAGSYGVYLESETGPTVLGIDLDADDDRGVRRIETARVRAGDIILLRRDRGGGDFIEDVANRLLGTEAHQLRVAQSNWKNALRAKVNQRGVRGVERDLKHRGTVVQNVRYWLSPSSIHTRSASDFRILMDYIGLGDRSDTIWAQMDQLNLAHLRAGQRVRHMLLDHAQRADLSSIEREGFMDFELHDEDAGALTAFRVEARAPEAGEIPKPHLREPFRVERESWLE